MYSVLSAWLRIVVEYWPEASWIRPLLAYCPFISPFFPDDESGFPLVCEVPDSKESSIEERLRGLRRVPWLESPAGVEEADRKDSTARPENGSGKSES